ncbi:MAG: DUF4115 domain-containing protein [Gammaproteobacteria bacterium]|nr:DUF4115 domain-containing protein [Gammaproteobacteria bacterium]
MAEIPSNKIDGVTLSSVGPGHRLRDARKLGNLDQSDIATQLNLDIATINALEKDDYSKMPPAVFVRGYLRAYAGMVGLPADDILASFDAMQGVDPAERNYRAPVRISATGVPKTGRSIVPTVLLVIIVIALAAGAYWWWQQRGSVSALGSVVANKPLAALDLGTNDMSSASVADSAADPAADPAVDRPALGVTGMPVDEQPVRITTPPVEEAPGDEPPTMLEEAAPAVAGPVEIPSVLSEPPAESVTESTPGTASAIDRLTLTYSDNCWTQVRDAAGKRLAFGVMKPGQVLDLSGVAPFDVTLGQSDGVSVEFNGKPFDHNRFSRGKIARFQIADEGIAQ